MRSEAERVLSTIRAAMDGPRPITAEMQARIVDMIDSIPKRCEWCGGSGRYAHEDPATGARNAIACPRCKGTGAASTSRTQRQTPSPGVDAQDDPTSEHAP